MFSASFSRWLLPFPFVLMLGLPSLSGATKFRPDDPLQREPPPVQAGKVKPRALSDYYDLFENTFSRRGERNIGSRFVRARSANTLGEVPDSPWYTNRISKGPMTTEELVRGPGNENGPSFDGPWTIVAPKSEG